MPLLKLNARLRRTATRNNRVPAALAAGFGSKRGDFIIHETRLASYPNTL